MLELFVLPQYSAELPEQVVEHNALLRACKDASNVLKQQHWLLNS